MCPAASKRKYAGAGYKSFTENLLRFSDIAEIPRRISLERLDDWIGIESTLRSRKASWYKSCRCKFNATKLERAENANLVSSKNQTLIRQNILGQRKAQISTSRWHVSFVISHSKMKKVVKQ